jgi:hypothetical protein
MMSSKEKDARKQQIRGSSENSPMGLLFTLLVKTVSPP